MKRSMHHSGMGFILVIWILLMMDPRAEANGFRNPPEGASALSLGGGKLAVVRGATTVPHNPAGMVDAEIDEIEFSASIGHLEIDFTGPGGRTGTTEEPWRVLPNFMGVFPSDDGNFAWGFAVTTPYGQSTEWKKDGPFRYAAPDFAELVTVDVAPSAAWRVNDVLSVGAGIDLVASRLTLEQFFSWSSALGVAGLPDGRAELEADGFGIGANASAQMEKAGHRLVFSVTSPVEVDYEGDFEISNVPPPTGGLVSNTSDFDTEIEFPAVLAAGYALQLTDKITLGADVEWIEFSRFDELPLDLGRNNPTGLFPPAIPQDWKDTWTFGLGGQVEMTEKLTCRVGYIWLESPIPEQTVVPTLPDSDRHIFSVGIGLQRARHRFDAGYAYSLYDDLTVDENVIPAFNGEYDIQSHLFSLSYIQTF